MEGGRLEEEPGSLLNPLPLVTVSLNCIVHLLSMLAAVLSRNDGFATTSLLTLATLGESVRLLWLLLHWRLVLLLHRPRLLMLLQQRAELVVQALREIFIPREALVQQRDGLREHVQLPHHVLQSRRQGLRQVCQIQRRRDGHFVLLKSRC